MILWIFVILETRIFCYVIHLILLWANELIQGLACHIEASVFSEPRCYMDHLIFMMYDRQKELDNARSYANHKYAIAAKKDQTITMLVKDRQSRRYQIDKKERIIACLFHRITDSEETIHERDM